MATLEEIGELQRITIRARHRTAMKQIRRLRGGDKAKIMDLFEFASWCRDDLKSLRPNRRATAL